jgi:penicillin-binding protein 2
MYQRRLRILTGCFCAGFLLVGLKLAYLQLLHRSTYEGLARQQPIREHILPTYRGSILDAHSRLLAGDTRTYELCVHPGRLGQMSAAERSQWLAQVADLVGRPSAELAQCYQRLERDLERRAERLGPTPRERRRELRWLRRRYHPLRVSLEFSEVARLEAWRDLLPRPEAVRGEPLRLRTTTRRHYPHGDVACHIIGYLTRVDAGEAPRLRAEHQRLAQAYAEVDPELFRDAFLKSYLPDESIGRRGLEKAYEWTLRGRRGLRREMVDAGGRAKKVFFDYPPQPGAEVHTTLDVELQEVAESALGSQRGAAVVLDVHTGAVLALVSSPRFDLEHFSSDFQRIVAEDVLLRRSGAAFYHRPRPLINRAIQETYPAGSVFKLVTALAALRAGVLRPQTEHTCRGTLMVAHRPRQCPGVHGPLDLRGAIERSCNVYFYQTALATPRAELLRTAHELGFGSPSGLDLPREAAGSLPLLHSDADVVNFAIGQGDVRVTPLQVAVMMAAIANGGNVLRPYLVNKPGRAQVLGRLELPPADMAALRGGMRDVVHGRRGTGRRARLTTLEVAGKTGTAEVEGVALNHAWFAGFAPYGQPRIAFAVVVEWTEGHGGDTAAPVAARILSQLRFPTGPGAAGARTRSEQEGRGGS